MYPDWLPRTIELNGASIDKDYEALYAVFQQGIMAGDLSIEGYPVIIDTHPDHHLPRYEAGFMHLVTRFNNAGLRTIDYERAPKLAWIPAIITNYDQPEVNAFWYDTPKGETLCLWLPDHDYALIMRWTNRSHTRKIIITAYSIDKHRRRSFQSNYGRATRIL